MIDKTHDLPVTRQAKELGISRSSDYYLPRAVVTCRALCRLAISS